MKMRFHAPLFSLLFILSILAPEVPIALGSEVHDVAVSSVTAWPTLVLPIMAVHINVTVENQGTSYETFRLAVYADNLTIETVTISALVPGLSETLTLDWEISPPVRILIFPPPWPLDKPMVENVTIWAEADVVPSEVDISDNIYTDGIVTIIWQVQDIDGDGSIGIKDIATVANAFGSHLGDPRWNFWVDFNKDGKIDIKDIAGSAVFFGRAYWLS